MTLPDDVIEEIKNIDKLIEELDNAITALEEQEIISGRNDGILSYREGFRDGLVWAIKILTEE